MEDGLTSPILREVNKSPQLQDKNLSTLAKENVFFTVPNNSTLERFAVFVMQNQQSGGKNYLFQAIGYFFWSILLFACYVVFHFIGCHLLEWECQAKFLSQHWIGVTKMLLLGFVTYSTGPIFPRCVHVLQIPIASSMEGYIAPSASIGSTHEEIEETSETLFPAPMGAKPYPSLSGLSAHQSPPGIARRSTSYSDSPNVAYSTLATDKSKGLSFTGGILDTSEIHPVTPSAPDISMVPAECITGLAEVESEHGKIQALDRYVPNPLSRANLPNHSSARETVYSSVIPNSGSDYPTSPRKLMTKPDTSLVVQLKRRSIMILIMCIISLFSTCFGFGAVNELPNMDFSLASNSISKPPVIYLLVFIAIGFVTATFYVLATTWLASKSDFIATILSAIWIASLYVTGAAVVKGTLPTSLGGASGVTILRTHLPSGIWPWSNMSPPLASFPYVPSVLSGAAPKHGFHPHHYAIAFHASLIIRNCDGRLGDPIRILRWALVGVFVHGIAAYSAASMLETS